MKIIPILNEPALVVNNTIKTLVISDIHLGIEWELISQGFFHPQPGGKKEEAYM